MKKNTPVKKIMSTDLATVHHGQSISEARKLMVEKNIHHVPVVSGDKLIGMLSWQDMMRISFTAIGANQTEVDSYIDSTYKLEDVMTKDPDSVSEDTTIREVSEILGKGAYHALPVTGESGKLTGIVTSTDLIRYLHSQF